MATEIHSKKIDGTTSYRMWCTVSDEYITDEMSEKELRQWTRDEAILAALREYDNRIEERIERATKDGTSSYVNPRENLKDWEKQRSSS